MELRRARERVRHRPPARAHHCANRGVSSRATVSRRSLTRCALRARSLTRCALRAPGRYMPVRAEAIARLWPAWCTWKQVLSRPAPDGRTWSHRVPAPPGSQPLRRARASPTVPPDRCISGRRVSNHCAAPQGDLVAVTWAQVPAPPGDMSWAVHCSHGAGGAVRVRPGGENEVSAGAPPAGASPPLHAARILGRSPGGGPPGR